VPNVNKLNTGQCPHGLPAGACPICSAGAGSMRQSDRNRKLGEMTYHECAMIGNMMKARALAQKRHEHNIEQRLENIKIFEERLEKLSEKIMNLVSQMSTNVMSKPVAIVLQNVVMPLLNFVQSIPRFVQFVRDLKIDIIDKLNAIYGEVKLFVEKKISELVSVIKSKLENIFRIFKRNNAKDDEKKVDDDKKIFNLKTILHKIMRRNKNDSSSKD
jgi:Na+/phosphate symporter